MTIRFCKARFANIIQDLPELFTLHGLEMMEKDVTAFLPNPDWKRYLTMDASGMLHIIAVRDDKKLVGYFIGLLYPHIHHQEMMGFTDMIFLRKEYRKGWTGYQLLKLASEMFRGLGAKKMYIGVKVDPKIRKVLKRLGFTHSEDTFSVVL